MLGSDVNVERASEDREGDYLIEDSSGQTVDVYRGWELEDGQDVIVVGEEVPDKVAEEVEAETIYETRWAWEVESATVVERDVSVRERPAYFAEEPPDNVALSMGHREAIELLERRGREASAGKMESAWYFPRRAEAGIHYTATDEADETYETYQSITGLSEEECSIAEGDWPAEDDGDGKMDVVDVAERIADQSGLYERQSQYAAAYVDGDESFTEVLRTLQGDFGEAELTYNDVTASIYKMRDRQDAIAWQVVHVWPQLPPEHRSEGMGVILDALEEAGVEASPRTPEWLGDEGDK